MRPTEKRIFIPRRTDDLIPDAIPWIGKVVTVDGWFTPWDPEAEAYVEDETQLSGYVVEFSADVPEYELVMPPEPNLPYRLKMSIYQGKDLFTYFDPYKPGVFAEYSEDPERSNLGDDTVIGRFQVLMRWLCGT